MVTAAEVMKRLGLRPWHEIEERARVDAKKRQPDVGYYDPHRSSGRTTMMMVDALVTASSGQAVYVVGRIDRSTVCIRKQLRRWCVELRIDPSLIVDRPAGATVFMDHSAVLPPL